ncbi:MAG: hypothetical protein IJ874_06075 [Ruminococcus sp.]|nr:hypothetical protein [Ruminococcus sp.]
MKKIGILAAAAVLCAVPVTAGAAEPQTPVFEYFNENDVNGTVSLTLPEDLTADVSISFDSPEGTGFEYYSAAGLTGGEFTFDIEGRDTADGDFRDYTLRLDITGGEYNTAMVYTDKFNIPDIDSSEEPVTLSYVFSADDAYTGNLFDTKETDGVKSVALHINGLLKGDVDGDRMVSAADASLVLQEYAALSTGDKSILTEDQSLVADVTGDSLIGSDDASWILSYYSMAATGAVPVWGA